MNLNEFWELLELVDQKALDEGDEESAFEKLTEKLIQSDVQMVNQFQEHLSQLLYQIDGEVWCDAGGNSSDSDDAFLYARCYVVAKGKSNYESVLSDPSKMPTGYDQWAELLLYVATNAWSEITGNDPEDYDYEPTVSYESASNTGQW